MSVQFSTPLMDAKNFPPAVIKAQPALSFTDSSLWHKTAQLDGVTTFSRARYALVAAALCLKRVGQNNTVLIPAYHCPALVEPFIYAGYDIKFYSQLPDLSTNIADFSRLLTPEVSHVVAVRYFGFSQNTDALMLAASAGGKIVIEDNAHSLTHFWRTCMHKPSAVSACVSSIPKTLGTLDGGVLYLPGQKINLPTAVSAATELRALVSGSMPVKASAKLSTELRYFRPDMQNTDCLRISRWLLLHSNYAAISRQRRANYQYLAQLLQQSNAGQPLYPTLAEHDDPYVLPFVLNDIRWFARLREEGIQVLRWEEIAESGCGVSADLKNLLVQLPCHQGLNQVQLNKIAAVLM